MGGDYFALCLALEELARVDSSVAITLEAAVSLGAMPIYRFGTEEQKREWLPRAVPRARRSAAFGLTEPGGGSDAGGTPTTARPRRRRVGDQRHRRRSSPTPAPTSPSLVTVTAVTGDRGRTAARRSPRSSCPSGTPGFTVSPKYSKVGWSASDTHELSFDDVRVPGGEPARRARPRLRAVPARSSTRAASRSPPCRSGSRRAASTSRCATPHERQAFGQPIGDYQAIQFKIADMEMRAHTARLAYYDAAGADAAPASRSSGRRRSPSSTSERDRRRQRPRGHPGARRLRLHERVRRSRRFYRDAKILEIGEGTSEVQRMLIARDLGL